MIYLMFCATPEGMKIQIKEGDFPIPPSPEEADELDMLPRLELGVAMRAKDLIAEALSAITGVPVVQVPSDEEANDLLKLSKNMH